MLLFSRCRWRTYWIRFCLVLLDSWAASHVAGYNYTKIADSTGPLSAFGKPSINASGGVAFSASLDGGGTGVFVGSGGSLTTIADELGPFSGFNSGSGPTINDSGVVAFYGVLDAGGANGVFTGSGGPTTTIATTAGAPYGGFDIFPSFNNSGVTSFSTFLDAGGQGVYASDGTSTTTIAGTAGAPFSSFDGGTSINAGSTVAFFARFDAGGVGIRSGNGGATTPIADTAGEFSDFGMHPAINAAGMVAFEAAFDAGGQGIFAGDGTTTTTVADSSGPYLSFIAGGGGPAINSAGKVAFFARLDDGGQGIFTGADAVSDKVIRTGDSLFGGTVSSVALLNALNDNGEIAFHYTLIGGVSGVAVATPSPASLVGDYNGNGVVDTADYIVWRKNSGTSNVLPNDPIGGMIGSAQFDQWRAHFGQPPASGSGVSANNSTDAAVPEPATLVLLMFAAAGWYLRRGRAYRHFNNSLPLM